MFGYSWIMYSHVSFFMVQMKGFIMGWVKLVGLEFESVNLRWASSEAVY